MSNTSDPHVVTSCYTDVYYNKLWWRDTQQQYLCAELDLQRAIELSLAEPEWKEVSRQGASKATPPPEPHLKQSATSGLPHPHLQCTPIQHCCL